MRRLCVTKLRALRCILVGLAAFAAGSARACDATTPCEVATGRYFVRPPADWDGLRALPVAVFFHGYRSSASDAMADQALGDSLSKAGVLLVAPDGRNGAWSMAGKLSTGRDEIAFVRDVLADLRRRYPVDDRRLVATGFSAGGFMVWRIACAAGDLFAAYAPISGAFLDPIPESCLTGPVSLRHVHGSADTVVPMSGRWIAGGRVRQSDVRESVARLREIDGCPDSPQREERRGELSCQVWPTGYCTTGRELELCLHSGGHGFDPAWIVDAMDWAGRLPPRP